MTERRKDSRIKVNWPIGVFLDNRTIEGIGFVMAKRKKMLQKKDLNLLVAFTPQINKFLNKSSIQLQIKDFKIK